LLGVSLPVFIGITLVLMGGGAVMVGQVSSATWRPLWQVVLYSVLLGFSARFLSLALCYSDSFFSPSGWAYGSVVDSVFLVIYGLIPYRIARVGCMAAQYPWICQRAGLFGYREKDTSPS
jgi:hypothetical protein